MDDDDGEPGSSTGPSTIRWTLRETLVLVRAVEQVRAD